MTDPIQENEDVLINRREVCAMLGCSLPTSYRYEKAGNFPGGLQLGPGKTFWRKNTVLKFLDEREANYKTERAAALELRRLILKQAAS